MNNKKTHPMLQQAGLSFKDVSAPPQLNNDVNEDVNIESDVESNIKSNDDVNVKSDSNKKILSEIQNYNKKEKNRALTVYLEPDVWKALDKFAKPKGKGAKSELINKMLKDVFDMEK